MVGKSAFMRHSAVRIDGHIVNTSIRYRRGFVTQLPDLTKSALEGAKLSFDLHQGVACLD